MSAALSTPSVIPFPAAQAAEYLHGSTVLDEATELAIVEAAAARYAKLPAVEQDGSYEWLIDAEFDALDAERRGQYEDSYAEHCGAFNRPRAW